MRSLRKIDLIRILFRSFYIQASWNYQRLIALGFCYCLIPSIKKLYSDKEGRSECLKRHLQFFNAHPYFASFALGAVARLEEKKIFEKWESDKPIIVFKDRLCGPLGAVGDKLFWQTIKPLTALLSVFTSLLLGFLGPIVLFVSYNIPHLYMRYYGIIRGYEMDFDIVRELSKRKYEKQYQILRSIGFVLLGLFIGYIIVFTGETFDWSMVAFLFLVVSITWYFVKARKPISLPIFLNLALLMVFNIFVP